MPASTIITKKRPGRLPRASSSRRWSRRHRHGRAWSAPSWREAAEQYHRDRAGRSLIVGPEPLKPLRTLLESGPPFSQVYYAVNSHRADGAPHPTIEALMLGLRERGTKALTEPDVQRRLSELNEAQLREVGARLQRLRPDIAKAWNPDEVVILVSMWTDLKNGQR
jgi:hypothetical protein